MKITVLCLAALFAVAPPAFAQEETATPEPKTSPSDPTVSVTTEKTASPSPKPSTSPTKSSSAAPKSSPSATPSSSSPPAAVMQVKKSSPEATIREIEDKWEGSVKN